MFHHYHNLNSSIQHKSKIISELMRMPTQSHVDTWKHGDHKSHTDTGASNWFFLLL